MSLTRQRLGLLVFGGAFVLLFAGFALAQGITPAAVPGGDIAIVDGAAADSGQVSEAAYRHALDQVAAQAGLKSTPKPGAKKYAEVKKSALASVIESVWIQGEADELGIAVTAKQVAAKLKEVKKQSFKTKAAYREFLENYHYTGTEVDKLLELELLSEAIQAQVTEGAPEPSAAAIEEDYEQKKANKFTTAATRDVRIVFNKSRAKVAKAKSVLAQNDSIPSWKGVAKRYSTSTLKQNGGLESGLSQSSIEEPLGSAVFEAPRGKLEGPVKISGGYVLFQVEKVTPRKLQPLSEVRAQIKSSLTKSSQEQELSEFSSAYSTKWKARTTCATGYLIEGCANYEGSVRPPKAPAGCYEGDPKGGLPEACPAPVEQRKPAVPGTVTLLQPAGEQLPQRPQPAAGKTGSKKAEGEAGAATEGE